MEVSYAWFCVCIRSTVHGHYCSVVLYYSSQDQRTALHYASNGGHHDTVRVLLERGADSNTRTKVSRVYIYFMYYNYGIFVYAYLFIVLDHVFHDFPLMAFTVHMHMYGHRITVSCSLLPSLSLILCGNCIVDM